MLSLSLSLFFSFFFKSDLKYKVINIRGGEERIIEKLRSYKLSFYKNLVPDSSVGQLFVALALGVELFFSLVIPPSMPRSLTGIRSVSYSHRAIFLLFRIESAVWVSLAPTIEYFISPNWEPTRLLIA